MLYISRWYQLLILFWTYFHCNFLFSGSVTIVIWLDIRVVWCEIQARQTTHWELSSSRPYASGGSIVIILSIHYTIVWEFVIVIVVDVVVVVVVGVVVNVLYGTERDSITAVFKRCFIVRHHIVSSNTSVVFRLNDSWWITAWFFWDNNVRCFHRSGFSVVVFL